jgi:PqqD family protein of HPr-rel-A system
VRYSINRKQVTFRVLDEGAVVVNCQSGYYHTLNATGTFLWELLDERDMTLEELTAALAHAYEQDERSVVADVKQHLDELRREDLVVAT